MSLNTPAQPTIHQPDQSASSHPISPPHVDRTSQDQDQERSLPIASPHGADDPSTAEPDAAQPFQPFFTLIEDKQTGEYHHPTVHYIFSDDDTDIVTAAALRSLEAQQDALSSSKNQHLEHEHEDQERSSLLPPPIPGVRENYIVLDVEPVPAENPTQTPIPGPANTLSTSPAQNPLVPTPGPSVQNQFRVTSAKSFSPAWQVLHSEMTPAPTFENSEAAETAGHGLMLKIQGTGGLVPASESGKGHGPQRLEEMMDQFAKRMAELQTVIDAVDDEELGEGQGAGPSPGAEEPGADPVAGPEPDGQVERDAEPVGTAENLQEGNDGGHLDEHSEP